MSEWFASLLLCFQTYLLCLQNLLISDWTNDRSLVRLLALPIVFSGFGAYFGAKAAAVQRNREQQYQIAKEELHQLCDLSMFASSMCNSLLGLNKQHVKAMRDDYDQQRAKWLSHFDAPSVEEKTLPVGFNLKTITCPTLHADEIFTAIRGVKNRGSNDLLQGAAIQHSCHNLASMIEGRNIWIAKFRSQDPKPDTQEALKKALKMYYGLRTVAGEIDQDYKSFIEGISGSMDDGIFHSHKIYQKIARQLVNKSSEFKKKYGESFRFTVVDFKQAHKEGLFPSEGQYASWLSEPPVIAKKRKSDHKKWEADVLSIIDLK